MRHFVLALLAASPLAAQQAVWVDATNGNDTNPGTASLPLRSITAGLGLAQTGTTVFVRPGTYSALATGEVFPLEFGVSLTHDGATLYGIGAVVVDFGGAKGNGLRVGTFANGGRITNIRFTNMDRNDWWTATIAAGSYLGPGSAAGFEIDRCRFEQVNRGVLIWENSIPVTGWRVHHNLFHDLGNDAINEFGALTTNEIYNNTIDKNPQLGILSDSDKSLVYNNCLTNLRVGLACGNTSTVLSRIDKNCFFANQKDVEGAGFGAGLPGGQYTVDPMYVGGGDFHLAAASPLIDAGNPNVFRRGDLDNVSSVVDSDQDGAIVPEVGCYEVTPMAFSASWQAATRTLAFKLDASPALGFIGLVVLSFDDGLIQIPGWSPFLLDPLTLVTPGFVGGLPLSASGVLPTTPLAGARIVLQGFGFDAVNNVLVPSRQQRVQF